MRLIGHIALIALIFLGTFSGCLGTTPGNTANKTQLAVTFTAAPTEGKAPLKVSFTIECSYESGLKDWTLAYGDGKQDKSAINGKTFRTTKEHTYSEGSFIAKLTVSALNGETVTRTRTITVRGQDNGGASGDTGDGEDSGSGGSETTLVQKPSKYSLTALELQGKRRIVLPESDYASLPILAPVFKNHGMNVSIEWNNGDGVQIAADDASKFSSQVAITFWEGKSTKAIVVDSYENALLVGPLACMLDAPILYYGSTTNEALWRVGAITKDDIISAGNAPFSNKVKISLKNQEAVQDYTISVAKEKGTNLNYIAVVNPDDDGGLESYFPQNAPYTAHLSCFGSIFAVYRNGIVISVANGSKAPYPGIIDQSIEHVASKLKQNGMTPKFLMLLGDSVSLPFSYYWFSDRSTELGKIPTDNVYANFDGTPSEGYDTNKENPGYPSNAKNVDVAHGRIIAKNLAGLSRYADRIFNYREYLAIETAPPAPIPTLNPLEWNNNALAYSSTAAEFGTPEEVQAWANMFVFGGFNTLEGSVVGHTCVPGAGSIVSGKLLGELFTLSNFIVAGADHGCPHGNSVWYNQLKPMPPNVNFQVSCLTGMIDTYYPDPTWDEVSKSDSFTYAMLDNGVAAYIASMRSTYGVLTGSYPMIGLDMGTAGDLAYFFMDNLISMNCTVGEALQKAKAQHSWDLISFEYQLYGDPAFNPYEPCNEGS